MIPNIYLQVDVLDLVYCWHNFGRFQELVQPGSRQYILFVGFERVRQLTS